MKKNVKDLEAMLADRANTVVQEKIERFKRDIENAFEKLMGTGRSEITFGNYHRHKKSSNDLRSAAAYIACLISDHTDQETGKLLAWPAVLWQREQDAIRTELLAKMDLMQQLLMSKPRDTSNDVPCE